MKKLLVSLVTVFATMAVMAENTDWQVTEVTGHDKSVAGYIYHTGAVGTQVGTKTMKAATSLRLVCSSKVSPQRSGDPLIAVYWNTMTGNAPQFPLIQVDKKDIGLPVQWMQDGQLLMRSVYESKELIQALKTGRNISFTWIGTDAVRRTTMFNLRDFNEHLGEFNSSCKTEL